MRGLYKTGKYEETVKIIKEIENMSAKLSMVHMATLYKLGSSEAFKEADEFVKNKQIDQNDRDSEITIRRIYTLFAIKQEKYDLAHRVRQRLDSIYKYACRIEKCDRNPLINLQGVLPSPKKENYKAPKW